MNKNIFGENNLIFALTGMVYKWANKKFLAKKTIKNEHSSALMIYYTNNGMVAPVSEGVVDDMPYSIFLSLINAAIIIRVELPFTSKIHLLGIPRYSEIIQINPTGKDSIFENISLEGDYDKYFNLYAEKGQQFDARYMLDPKAMAFTVDFCRSHSWEVLGSELYFVQSGRKHIEDPTSMFEDVSDFVKNIRPSVERALTKEELRNITPYGFDRRTGLKCPICGTELNNFGRFYDCPNKHGVLLIGKYLTEIKEGKMKVDSQNVPAVKARGNIICPSCHNKMTQVNFNNKKTIIDSCIKCPYRWLDGADLVRLTNK